jgi:hypothetical protein
MTAVAGAVFTAAQYNTFIRDNDNECPAAKAVTPGAHFAVSATNQVAERITSENAVTASESTSSTTYTVLTTPGPAVTVTTGGKAIVWVTCDLACGTAGQTARATFNVSGATVIAESDALAVRNTTNASLSGSVPSLVSLTPGSNTFTVTYRTSGASTSTFGNRRILVVPY